jgi:hypothetical protein
MTKPSSAQLRPRMDELAAKKHFNVAVVALADKLARIAWAVLT